MPTLIMRLLGVASVGVMPNILAAGGEGGCDFDCTIHDTLSDEVKPLEVCEGWLYYIQDSSFGVGLCLITCARDPLHGNFAAATVLLHEILTLFFYIYLTVR